MELPLIFIVILSIMESVASDNITGTPIVTRIDNNSGDNACVSLGVEADSYLEKIDPHKLLFVDTDQRSYLRQACENYKKMRTQNGCVPQQPNSIYDYACDTISALAESPTNSACWNRTSSCSLIKLLPATETITAAYCRFLTSIGLQLGCALELTPACENPSNAVISQAATKSRSFLDNFQCAVLAPPPAFATIGAPVGPPGPPTATGPPTAAVIPSEILSADDAFVLKSNMPACNLGQNAKGLFCASNLLGVQEKFSDTSGSLIFQELSKNESTELVEICKKFESYHSCMYKDVFTNGQRCMSKSHIHDFSLLFYAFCDPQNALRVRNLRPCVQKLQSTTDAKETNAFQMCKQKLTDMRAEVKNVLKNNQNSLAMCRGILSARGFFDCVPPIVRDVCGNEAVTDMAFFRDYISQHLSADGCPLDDPRLRNYVDESTTPSSITPTPIDVFVKSATIGVIETENKASTVKVDQSMPMIQVNVLGDQCTPDELNQFNQCYANVSGLDFHPMSILKKPDQRDTVCRAYDRFDLCMDNVNCGPPGGDGLRNMLGLFCKDENNEFAKYRTCMQKAADSPIGQQCYKSVLPINILGLANEDTCDWVNGILNCSYNELQSKCSIETADYAFKIWQAFAKGVNASCLVEVSLADDPNMNGVPVECSSSEEESVKKCIEPFHVITDNLKKVLEGGIQGFMRGMKKITEIFQSGCEARLGFDDCMRKSVSKGSKCHASSCLIKVSEYACNFSGQSDMSLEDRLKCMWSLIGEPGFGKCLRIFPKNAFSDINRLRLYLPKFIKCLEEPLLRKCGQTTLNLVRALSSQSTSDPSDQTCVVYVPGLNDANSTVTGPKEIGAVRVATAGTKGTTITASTSPKISPATSRTTPSTPKRASVPPVIDTRPLCRKPEEGRKIEKCHMALSGGYTPVAVKIFIDPTDLDAACNAYKNFSSCAKALPCRFEFTSAIQEMLIRVCTVRYDDYKATSYCLSQVADSPKGVECTTPLYSLNLTEPQTDGGEKTCQTINTMIACITPEINDRCNPPALDVVYDLHTALAKQFKSDCNVKPPVLLVPGTECTSTELNAFQTCMQKPKNYSLNPVSIIGNPDQLNDFCAMLKSDFQPCLRNLPCTPKPYTEAFNDSYSSLCTEESKSKFEKFKPCLSSVLNTPVGRDCVGGYTDLQWYSGDDWRGNGDNLCKSTGSSLTCSASEISQRCDQDALKFVYEFNQKLVGRVKSDCKLIIPANLPTKLNMTTEAPTIKTTPSKAKDAISSSAEIARNSRIFGMILCVIAIIQLKAGF